jgi:dipeptidyl aminopeptidase/acylaminoacyl peptidase/serine/threonine protein kinase/Tfp pilus assembly protein PilF
MNDRQERPVSPGDAATVNESEWRRVQTRQGAAADAEDWSVPGGRYQLLGEIARGGMGQVLRVHDLSLDRQLAVKVLPRDKAPSDEAVRRFLEEAQITGQLQHPSIPPVHEVGRLSDGSPFFSMKLIDGRTLAELLEARPSPADDLLRFLKVFEQIAQSLAYAHSQGIIHRDLKPQNVMVGAFGEVQVMDWGLAKRIRGQAREESASGEPLPGNDAPEEKRLATSAPAGDSTEVASSPVDTRVKTPALAEPADRGRLTQAGQALGTPAFMSPEQARGDVQSLDERTDVFGLGAILCVMLTGQPPYGGPDRQEAFRRAAEADLSEATARLRECRADAELISLCELCLDAEPASRPANGGIVADRIGGYLASLQRRLEEAHVERAAAEVRATEERKRRRLGLGLGAAILLFVAGGSIAAVWYINDRAIRDSRLASQKIAVEREVAAALDDADRELDRLQTQLSDPRGAAQLLSDLSEWQRFLASARAARARADSLISGNRELVGPELLSRQQALSVRLEEDERGAELAAALDRIRLEMARSIGGRINLHRVEPDIERTLMEYGIDLRGETPEHNAEKFRRSNIRLPLVAAADFWLHLTRDLALRERLLEVARMADPDPWRDRVRQADVLSETENLKALVDEADFARQSPQLLCTIASFLRLHKADSTGLVRRALVFHPRDFWLHLELGQTSSNVVEQTGAFRAAQSIRPDNSYVYYALGVLSYQQRRLGEAKSSYEKAIELDPTSSAAHMNLALVLEDLKRPDEAFEHYRAAVELDPDNERGWSNLGATHYARGELDEAVRCYRRAIAAGGDRPSAATLNNLGTALKSQRKLDEAAESFRQSIQIDPQNAYAWCNLGHLLVEQEKFDQALEAFKRGDELGRRDPNWRHPSEAWVKEAEFRLAVVEKLPAVLRGEASLADPRENLMAAQLCLLNFEKFAASARFYVAAFQAQPELVALEIGNRHNACVAVANAPAGKGDDAAGLSDTDRIQLSQYALEWLRADFDGRLRASNPSPWTALADYVHNFASGDWQALRQEAANPNLPADVQDRWTKLWADIDAARADVDSAAGVADSPGPASAETASSSATGPGGPDGPSSPASVQPPSGSASPTVFGSSSPNDGFADGRLISRSVLFQVPQRINPSISPDGSQISFLNRVDGVYNVWVGPIDNPGQARASTRVSGASILDYVWSYTNRHLLYLHAPNGGANRHLFRVDLESGATTDLTPLEGVAARMEHLSPRFPDEILVGLNDRDRRRHDVYRLRISTGERTLVWENSGFDQVVCDDDFQVRFAVRLEGEDTVVCQRNDDGEWTERLRYSKEDGATASLIGCDASGQSLYLFDTRNRDTRAVAVLEPGATSVRIIAENERADATGTIRFPPERTIQAVSFNHTRVEWTVLDPQLATDFEALRANSEGDLQILGRSLDGKDWIVSFRRDVEPIRYCHFDSATRKTSFLFSRQDGMDGLAFSAVQPVEIPARDGLKLVCYLTLPSGSDEDGDGIPSRPLPMVVWVHDGPWERDTWGFDPEQQWLADRGYAVLSVNYRGSWGFGKAFRSAGDREWGGAMNNDLVDAARWAVERKIAQGDRLAVMGTSYGGFAVLSAMTQSPEVFACGVDLFGPPDLLNVLRAIPPQWEPHLPFLKQRIGDPDREDGLLLLTERSPIVNRDRITRPLLIVQGARDPRARSDDALKIVQSMQERNVSVCYVLFPNEAHGLRSPNNRLACYAVIEAFLARHLGGRCQPVEADFDGSPINIAAGAADLPGLAASEPK